MSERVFLSGAQKRKLAAEKKKKEEEQLKKIPKINQSFNVEKPSSSKAITSKVESFVETEAAIESESETQLEKGIDQISINEGNFEEVLANVFFDLLEKLYGFFVHSTMR